MAASSTVREIRGYDWGNVHEYLDFDEKKARYKSDHIRDIRRIHAVLHHPNRERGVIALLFIISALFVGAVIAFTVIASQRGTALSGLGAKLLKATIPCAFLAFIFGVIGIAACHGFKKDRKTTVEQLHTLLRLHESVEDLRQTKPGSASQGPNIFGSMDDYVI